MLFDDCDPVRVLHSFIRISISARIHRLARPSDYFHDRPVVSLLRDYPVSEFTCQEAPTDSRDNHPFHFSTCFSHCHRYILVNLNK